MQIAFVIFAVIASVVLQRSATIRNTVRDALVGTYDAVEIAVTETAHFTLLAIRIMALTAAIYLSLLFAATAFGWAPLQFAVLILGLIVAFAAMYVLAILRLPVAEIGARLTGYGTRMSGIPLGIKSPEGFAPASATGWKIAPAIGLGIILPVFNGLWLFPALVIWALGGILRAFGALAAIAEKTLRTLARTFATIGMGLLFLTVISMIDASLGTHVLDFATLTILTLLAMAATFLSFLATDRIGKDSGVPWSALWMGALSIMLILGTLYALKDPLGAREIARSFRNSKDAALTFARIGNDQGQITSHAYWRTRAGTVLRPCAHCTVLAGTINGRVGDPVEVKAETPLASLRTEEPVELDGVLWIRVFRPYREDKPSLGYNLVPGFAWLAPKDFLDGDVRPETPEPRAPVLTTMKGIPAKLTALAPLMLFAGLLLLPALMWGGTTVLRRAFNRPNQAAAATARSAAAGSAGSSGNGHDSEGLLPRPFARGLLVIFGLLVLSPILMLVLSTVLTQGMGYSMPAKAEVWKLTSSAVTSALLFATLIIGFLAVFFAHDKMAMFKKMAFILMIVILIKVTVPDISGIFPDWNNSGTRRASGDSRSVMLSFVNPGSLPQGIDRILQEAYRKNGVIPELVAAVCMRESGCNPKAPDGGDGEIGPMQIMPSTGKSACGLSASELRDPEKNIDCGAKLLAQYIAQFPSRVDLAVHAYYSPKQAADFYARRLGPEEIRAEIDREVRSPAGIRHNPWRMLTKVIRYQGELASLNPDWRNN